MTLCEAAIRRNERILAKRFWTCQPRAENRLSPIQAMWLSNGPPAKAFASRRSAVTMTVFNLTLNAR
jgi:hypothetical protein